MFSCSDSQESKFENTEVTKRRSLNKKQFLLRDYGTKFGLFEMETGDFIYCDDCQNNLDLDDDLFFEGIVELNNDGEVVWAYDNNGAKLFSIVLDRSREKHIENNRKWKNIKTYEVSSIGFSTSTNETSQTNSNFNWAPGDVTDFEEELPLCQCVSTTSTPCNATSSDDHDDPCDIGGPGSGATGCGTGSGQGGSGTIMGTGASGSASSSCSITCGDGYEACCHY